MFGTRVRLCPWLAAGDLMLAELITDWRIWCALVVFYGVLPGSLLRLLIGMYPPGHDRRAELLAELARVKPAERPIWVLGHVETVWQEAPQAWRALGINPLRRLLLARRTQLYSTMLTVINLGSGAIAQIVRGSYYDDTSTVVFTLVSVPVVMVSGFMLLRQRRTPEEVRSI
jgi:hypothetical protein